MAERMEGGYINAVEDALGDCAISPLRADALGKIFAELRRARAAEVDAIAEADRWRDRCGEQLKLKVAATAESERWQERFAQAVKTLG